MPIQSFPLALAALVALAAPASLAAQDPALAPPTTAAPGLVARRARLDAEREAEGTRTVRWPRGHPATPLRVVRFSPDGERLLSLAEDGSARLWDAYGGDLLARLGPFCGGELEDRRWVAARFSPDGETILVHDPLAARASLWDGRNGSHQADVGRPDELVRAAVFGPDGAWIALAAERGVQLFDGQSGAPLERLATDVAFAALETHPHRPLLLGVGVDGRLELWNVERGERLATLGEPGERGAPGPVGPIGEARFARDGEHVLAHGRDGRLAVLRARDLAPRAELGPHLAPLGGLELSGDGAHAWTIDGQGGLVLHALGGASVRLREGPPGAPGATSAHGAAALGAVFSPDGLGLAAQDRSGRVALHEIGRAEPVRTLEHAAPADLFGFTPDGARLVVGDARHELCIFDARDGRLLGRAPGGGDQLCALSFSSGADRVALGTYRGYALVLDLDRPGEVALLRGRSRPSWAWQIGTSPDGAHVAATCFSTNDDALARGVALAPERSSTIVWDLATGLPSRTLAAPPGVLLRYALFDPTGERIVAAAATPAGEPLICRFDADPRVATRTLAVPAPGGGPADLVRGLRFGAAGERLFGWTWERGGVLWATDSGEVLATFPELARVDGLPDLAPDGRGLLAPGPSGELLGWTEASGRWRIEGHGGPVWACAFSPDGTRCASGGLDGTTRLWTWPAGEPCGLLAGGSRAVLDVRFDARGERLVSAELDGVARVWDVESGALLAELAGPPGEPGGAALVGASFAPGGERVLALAEGADRLRLHEPDGKLVALLRGHEEPIGNACFVGDERILTVSGDHSTRVWDARDGRLLLTRVAFEDDQWLCFEPGGRYVASADAADWAEIRVGARWFPLSSYAAVLADPGAVAAALAGERAPRPQLDAAPEIDVDQPLEPLVGERRVTLAVEFEDEYGIAAVTLEQDGRALPAELVRQHLAFGSGRRAARLSIELDIAPPRMETQLAVRATNVRGVHSRTARLAVRYEPPERDLYLVAMGVADYDDDELDLRYPVADVDGLIARLALEEGGLYRAVHVQRIVERELTSARLRRVCEEFLRRARPEDTIVVFAAGHGVRTESGEYYLLTSAASPRDPWEGIDRPLLERLVRWDGLFARRRVLLLDTCNSGQGLGTDDTAARTRGGRIEEPTFAQQELDGAFGQGIYVLAATPERGFARELEGGGLFTRVLLEGLDGAADAAGAGGDEDGWVEVDELFDFASRVVAERSAGRQRVSVPRVEGGEPFALAKARASTR